MSYFFGPRCIRTFRSTTETEATEKPSWEDFISKFIVRASSPSHQAFSIAGPMAWNALYFMTYLDFLYFTIMSGVS